MIITKLDAARRQLVTAISLFFSEGDPVSIHTLTAAAFRVLQNLCDARPGQHKSATKLINECIQEGHHDEIWKLFTQSANFFKHADRDPAGVHDFVEEETPFLMFLSVMQFESLTEDRNEEMEILKLWCMVDIPRAFRLPEDVVASMKRINHKNRPLFYKRAGIALRKTVGSRS